MCTTYTGCTARVHTDLQNGDTEHLDVLHYQQHNHPPYEEAVASAMMKHKLCQLARDRPTESLEQVTVLIIFIHQYVNSQKIIIFISFLTSKYLEVYTI